MEVLDYEELELPLVEPTPAYSDGDEVERFLSANYTARRLLRFLLSIGLTVEELEYGLRHPRFLSYCAAILGPAFFSVSVEQKRDAIRIVIYKIKGLIDVEIAESQGNPSPQPKKGKAKKRERKRKANNDTLRRLSILASLYEQTQRLSISEIEELSCLKLRAISDALKVLEKEGYIKKEKGGRQYLYRITHRGIAHLISSTMQELQCHNRQQPNRTHCNSCIVPTSPLTRARLLELIRIAIEINTELLAMGWYARCVKAAFLRHRLEYIQTLIQRVKGDKNVVDKGAYLYAILVKGVPEDRRREAIEARNLSDLPSALLDVYREQAATMTVKEASYLALQINPDEPNFLQTYLVENSRI